MANFYVNIHLLPYFVCATGECPGETAQQRRLARALACRLCGKPHFQQELSHLLMRVLLSYNIFSAGYAIF